MYLLFFSNCFQLEIHILVSTSDIFDVNNPRFATVVYIPAASRFLHLFNSYGSTQKQAAFAWSVCHQNKLGRISKNILYCG